MDKTAPADHPLHPLIAARWSPRSFLDTPVPEDQLRAVLEAARWAASCFNAQPWRFIVATSAEPEAHALLAGLMVEANAAWAARAPVLIVALARTTFAHNGAPNPHAWHDLGQAVAQLTLQATALGLHAHQMAGIRVDAIREAFALPEDVQPVSMIALGRLGEAEALPEPLASRERAPRSRAPQAEFVFSGAWGRPRP